MSRKSNLDLVNECDNFPYHSTSSDAYEKALADYYHFRVKGCDTTLGYIPSKIAQQIPASELWTLDEMRKLLVFNVTAIDEESVEHRNQVLAKCLEGWREQQIFSVLSGWRNECYPIYGPNRKLLLSMERSATPLFGVVTYGVHMTAYVRSVEGIKIWVPRRAETKQTYPGMMDNSVAGGLSTGERPFECLIRESQEEASLSEDIVQSAQACGTLTYFHVRDARAGGETGLCQPECQYIYDLELPSSVIPKPGDNEAVDFRLLTVKEVQDAMAAGKFKPNCAHLLLEFFIRHGVLTPENEPDYIEVVARVHRRLEFPTA